MAIERLIPETDAWSLYYGNHIVRYMFANEQIKIKNGSKLLDAATGVGYGANYLAKMNPSSKITAIDISNEALLMAKNKFALDNITFIQEDCNTLEKITDNFDYVVSFETLEHLTIPQGFLSRIFQLLVADGTAIISTPNIQVTGFHTKNDWEFHEKEYSASEFYELLKNIGFKNIRIFGQQFSSTGKLKNQIRHELHLLRSNPFARFGFWIQKNFRNHIILPPLPETLEDFKIVEYNHPLEIESLKETGPFVLIAVVNKP